MVLISFDRFLPGLEKGWGSITFVTFPKACRRQGKPIHIYPPYHQKKIMSYLSFSIRAYYKSDLAQLYFPLSPSRREAVRNLLRLIQRTPALQQELQDTGIRTYAKIFSARQVEIIVRHIGTP